LSSSSVLHAMSQDYRDECPDSPVYSPLPSLELVSSGDWDMWATTPRDGSDSTSDQDNTTLTELDEHVTESGVQICQLSGWVNTTIEKINNLPSPTSIENKRETIYGTMGPAKLSSWITAFGRSTSVSSVEKLFQDGEEIVDVEKKSSLTPNVEKRTKTFAEKLRGTTSKFNQKRNSISPNFTRRVRRLTQSYDGEDKASKKLNFYSPK